MVTFSSKSQLGPGNPKGKRRKKVNNKNKGVVTNKGKYLKNTVKPKKTKPGKTKHLPNGRSAWNDLRTGEKIVNILKGDGPNSVQPNGTVSWIGGKPKPIKSKIPRAVKYDKDDSAINPIPHRGVEKIDINPNWRSLQLEKKKKKNPVTISRVEDFIKNNTVQPENVYEKDDSNVKIKYEPIETDEGFINIRTLPDTGDGKLNELIKTGLINDKEIKKYNSDERKDDYNKLEEKGKIENQEEEDLFMSGGSDEFVKIEDFRNKMQEVITTDNPDTDLDPDFDFITKEDIEDYDPDLYKRIEESVPKVTVDGAVDPKQAQLIGVKFNGDVNIKDIIQTPKFNYDLPMWKDGEPTWKIDLIPEEYEYTISQSDEGVFATPDGRTFTAPLDFAEFSPSNSSVDGFEIISDKDTYKPSEFQKETFMDKETFIYTDPIFKPELELLLDENGIVYNPSDIDCDKSKKIFNSAVSSLPSDFSGIMNNEQTDFNNSEFRAYGFFMEGNRLYAKVDFDENGLPKTEDITADFYTGSILGKDGKPAVSIPIGKWNSETTAAGFGGAVGVKPPTEEELKYRIPSNDLPTESPRFKSFDKNAGENVKKWMQDNAECYNKLFDESASQKLQDNIDKAEALQKQYSKMQSDLVNSVVSKELNDVANKNRVINASVEAILADKVSKINGDVKDINELKDNWKKLVDSGREPSQELTDEINGRIDLVDKDKVKYKQILEDYNNMQLQDYNITYLDKAGNNIYLNKSDWSMLSVVEAMKAQDIETTVLSSPNSDLQFSFPKSSNNGVPPIISETVDGAVNLREMAMPDVGIENNAKQADLHEQYGKEKDKQDYVDKLFKEYMSNIPDLMLNASKESEETLEALKNKDTTWAQATAWGINRIMGNIIKIIPGLTELALLVTEAGLRVTKAIIAEKEEFFETDLGAQVLKDYADSVHKLSDEIAIATDKIVDEASIKPGGNLEPYDLAKQDIESSFAGQTVGLLLDITMDIIGTKGLSTAGRSSRIAQGIDWATDPTKRRFLGDANSTLLDAYNAGKINKRGLATLVITENTPITILARLTQDGVAETNKLIEEWEKNHPGQKIPLDAGDLLIIELLKPVVEASMDKIGIDFIAGRGVMPKLVTHITNKALTKKPAGITLREFVDKEIKAMTKKGIIKSGASTIFNVADEVIQEEFNMIVERRSDLKFLAYDAGLYGTTEFGTDEHMARLYNTAKVSLVGIGILETTTTTANVISESSRINSQFQATQNQFKNIQKLRVKTIKDAVLKALQVQLEKSISQVQKRTDLNKKEKREKIQELKDIANENKKNAIEQHNILQKIDINLNPEDALTQYNLELKKVSIEKELEKELPQNIKKKKEEELSETEKNIDEHADKILDTEKNVKEEFISDESKEFDRGADQFLNRMKDEEADVVVAETSEEAEKIANDLGTSMNDNPAKYYVDSNTGKQTLIFSRESTLLEARQDGKLRLKFDHEGDHFVIEKLEKIAGKQITVDIAEAVQRSINNNEIVFKNKKVKLEFQKLMTEYSKLPDADKQMMADELIVNLRELMDKGDAKVKKSLLEKIKATIIGDVNQMSNGVVEIDIDSDAELLKLIDLMAEGKVEEVKEVVEKIPTRKTPEKPKKPKDQFSYLDPLNQSMPNDVGVKDRQALIDNEAEKKKLVKQIQDLVRDGKEKNKNEINKIQTRIKELNKGIQNAEDVATIEDPKSGQGAKQRAENRLDENNKEALVQYVVNSRMTGDNYIGKITLKDGSQLSYSIPRSEIEDGLRSKEYPNIYTAFFKRDAKFKDMPFGLKVKNDLMKRWQQVVDPLIQKDIREQRDNAEGPSLLDGTVAPEEVEMTKEPADIKYINMRQAIGLLPGSDVYNEIKEGVKNTFKGKLPTLESGNLKKALQDAYALNTEKAVKKLIEEMGGVEPFLRTYGEEIYDIMPQSIMNKTFQEFTVKGERLNTEETRKAEEKGEITRSKSKTKDTAGNYIYTKEPYSEDKWIAYHMDPKSIGAKSNKYKKKDQLIEALGKILGIDATMEVLSDKDVMDMFNERNQLLNQADVLVEEIGYLLNKDSKARFALGIGAKDIDTVRKQIMGAVKKAYDKATKNPQTQIDAFDDELELLDPELLRIYAPIFDRLKQLFRTKATGYKKKVKNLIETAKIPENYKIEARKVNETQTQSLGKGLPEAMKEIHNYAKDVMERINSRVAKALNGANFFSYMYGYLDGGDKSRGKGEKFGPYKSELDEVNNIIAKLKDTEKLDFTPEDIRLINATSGILSQAETILDKDLALEDTTDENGKLIKGKRTLLGINEDGTVKPGEIFDQLQKANVANIKAIDYVLNKSAQAIAQDNSLIPGFLRWLETMTNNTKSLRALSRLANMEVLAGSQAAFYNIETGKYKNSLSATDKKSGGWETNYNHPRYNEAEKEAKEKEPNDIEKQQAIIAKKLNYKGEHIDVASNLFAELGVKTLETAAKLEKANGEKEKEGILESFSNENELALRKYDQSHTTKVEADGADKKTSTTDATDYIRVVNLPRTPDKISVADPNLDVQEEVEEKIVTNEEIIEAIDNNIKEIQEPKTSNNEAVEDSGVMEMDGDLTGPEVLSKMATLDAALINARSKMPELRKLRVFDFDDTLAKTNSKVFYTMPDGSKGELTAEEYAAEGDRIKEEGGEFDFSDFNRVVSPEGGPMLDLFKKMYSAEGKREMVILTARGPESALAIQAWLKSEGLDIALHNIIGLGNSNPHAKAEYFVVKAAEGYNDFYFSDDAPQNVQAVEDVLKVVDVKSKVQQAKQRFALDGEKIANRLFQMIARKNKKLSEEGLRNISEIKAEIKGASIKENIFAMSSTENFTGLLYKFLGKGQEGNEDWDFLKDNLVRPYTRGLNELANIKNTLIADFNATLKNFVGRGKPITNLREEVPGLGGYTYEDAIRILAWDSKGTVVEGVPKSTMEKIRSLGRNNQAVKRMADQLNAINKGDDYYYPGKRWRAGTMMSDLMLGVNKVKRPKILYDWNENIETIFGKDDGNRFNGQIINAIEATYGSKYREALEDMLRRMKTGKNRRAGSTKLENRFFDWLNNSVGAVMFFNMRSGVLQTLSAANYLNWSFNNPAKAAATFANQPQYWRDFMTLMNSPFLVDRRGGNKINISEAEIFDATNNQSNKAKAFMNLLIKKGFSITQVADSFAIASGGSTYYRNRIKDLLKKNPEMSKDEAEAQAYEEWTALSREAQQSSDSMEVSSQQAGGLGRVILAFANTPMQYNRLITKSIRDLAAGRGDFKTNLSRIAYYGAIQNMIFNSLQQALFAAIGNGDEEELDEDKLKILDGMLTSLMRGMGVAGSIMSAIKDVGLDVYERTEKPRPEYYKAVFEALNIAPPLDVKVSKFVRGMNQYEYNRESPNIKDPFDIENPLYMSGALLTASVTNIPLDRVLQKIVNIKDAFAQEQENWKRIALLMGWSKWQLESQSQQEAREEEEGDAKHYYRAIEKPSLYNAAEQKDILMQHGFTEDQIKSLKTQDQKVNAILAAQISSDKIYTSKIPNVKADEIQETKEVKPIPVPIKEEIKQKEPVKPTPVKIKADSTVEPKKVNFTNNTSFKNNRVPVEKRNPQELKLYELPAVEQKDSLRSLGLSDAEIKALKYEGDRVRKILELQK